MFWFVGCNFGFVGSNIQNIVYIEFNGEKFFIGNFLNSVVFYGNIFVNINVVFIIVIKMLE